jgi:hypothetical protein
MKDILHVIQNSFNIMEGLQKKSGTIGCRQYIDQLKLMTS